MTRPQHHSIKPHLTTASISVARELHDRAIYVGRARRLSLVSAATAEFDPRVYANRMEPPPVTP